ncbi:sugar transporter SWEET1 isoform X4 [Phocoena sinus]|uniref:sugar transporter SWEET1 isoform X4 n=1 Tax=Phocoena sinus TaxID=42100 RepID=UPI0013C458A7|nr:sugar transporter SWEET1 isoform X4 [Phocoena sinus]
MAERAGAEPGAQRGGAPASRAPVPASWPQAPSSGSDSGRDGGGRIGRLASFRSLRALHPRHVLHRPLGPQAHADDPECGQCPVPALSHHGCQVRGAINLSWLSYGALKGNWTLIVVNAVGAVLQTLYILVYLHYCHRKHAVLLQTATLLGVLVLGFGYFWLLVPDTETRLQQLGLFCSVFTISMYLSPLADLAKVIRTKSTQRLSFSLTIATLLTSASWTFYGFRLKDPYIVVPNLPGILTSFIRFWLFWKYPQEQDRNYQLLQT